MKRILCLIDNLGSGGAQRQMVNLAVLLKEYGYDIDFVVYADIGFYEPILVNEGIQIKKLLAHSNIERIINVCSYIKKVSPDVVISFLEVPCFLACVSKMCGGKYKVITTERSAKMRTFQTRRNRFFNWFERFSDAKICNSEKAKNMWLDNYPKYREKYKVIYNPVLMDIVEKCEYGFLKDGLLHVVVAASYQELKNPLKVIEAVKQLEPAVVKRLRIDWYGNPEIEKGNTVTYDRAIRLVTDYELEGIICLHEETPDIYRVMFQADMVGLFSTVEGLPNAICEGMALGKPILMSRVSDYEVLTGENGISFEPSVVGIRKGLESALSLDREQLRAMGRASSYKAKQLFSPEMILKQWIEVIEQ